MPEGRSRIGERASWRSTLREWGELAAASSSHQVGHRDEMWSSGMTRLDGKTALITGSTDGVGRVVAKRLGEAGARVLVHGRNRERGERLVAEIKEAGGTAEFLAADLAPLARG